MWTMGFKLVSTFGISAGFAVYLLYFLTSVLSAKLDLIESTAKSNHSDTAYLVMTSGEDRERSRQLNLLLQAICVNTAKTNNERNQCFGVK